MVETVPLPSHCPRVASATRPREGAEEVEVGEVVEEGHRVGALRHRAIRIALLTGMLLLAAFCPKDVALPCSQVSPKWLATRLVSQPARNTKKKQAAVVQPRNSFTSAAKNGLPRKYVALPMEQASFHCPSPAENPPSKAQSPAEACGTLQKTACVKSKPGNVSLEFAPGFQLN